METQNNRKLLQLYDAGSSLPPPSINHQEEPITAVQNATTSASQPLGTQSLPFDSSMAVTIVVLLTALFFMGFFSVYIRRVAQDSRADISRRPRRERSMEVPRGRLDSRKGLDLLAVRSMPVYLYGSAVKHRIDDCAICLSEFEEGECVKVIPHCRHVFQVPCVDTWLSSHVSCPVCRNTELFVDKGASPLEEIDGGER